MVLYNISSQISSDLASFINFYEIFGKIYNSLVLVIDKFRAL